MDVDCSQRLENFAWVFCFNASTVSSFELALADLLNQLNIWFVSYKLWETGRNFRCSNSAVLVFTQIKWTFVVSILHFSFISYSTNQNKTAACLCVIITQYFFHAPRFYTRIVLGNQKRNFYKTAILTMIVRNCWKTLLQEKSFHASFSAFFLFVLESDCKTFSRPLPTFVALCSEYTVMNTMRIWRKTQSLCEKL